MMRNRWPLCLSLVVGLLLGAAGQVQAHRQHINWTSITWNPTSQQLEIEHQLHEHDAQLILGKLQQALPDLLRTTDRARVALYVAERFSLTLADQNPAPLELIGAELSGSMLFVYQSMTLASAPEALTISTRILMDLYPDQINKVNIDITQPTQTLSFNRQSGPEVAQITN
jgi:hypothetical protein